MPANIPSVSVARVKRNDVIITCPWNLLVEDDVIEMTVGERAPCRIENIEGDMMRGRIFLSKGDMLRPGLMCLDALTYPPRTHKFLFRLLETPLYSTFKSALEYRRPETIISHRLTLLLNTMAWKVLWILIAVSQAVNIFRFVFSVKTDGARKDQALDLFFNLQLYAVLPLLPLSLPALCLVARSYGNAQIVCLQDLLQSSKLEFKDEEDVDEFDPAPVMTFKRPL
ncbi:hypothetical protein HK101_004007 [Irineochytrium annulatum]|nr:hypothetical protein HK101_004007 [Irineochytrium annulatum]